MWRWFPRSAMRRSIWRCSTWCGRFPDAPGLRTQLRVKALPGFDPKGLPEGEGTHQDYGAHVPHAERAQPSICRWISPCRTSGCYWGYYNNPGNRHDQSQDMLQGADRQGLADLPARGHRLGQRRGGEYGDAGVIVVKESPKCVNQPAHYTGAFYANPPGLAVDRLGADAEGDRARALPRVLGQLDASCTRAATTACNWRLSSSTRRAIRSSRSATCSSSPTPGGRPIPAARSSPPRSFVLKEIPALADLGVDVLQIDDGWQKSRRRPGRERFPAEIHRTAGRTSRPPRPARPAARPVGGHPQRELRPT